MYRHQIFNIKRDHSLATYRNPRRNTYDTATLQKLIPSIFQEVAGVEVTGSILLLNDLFHVVYKVESEEQNYLLKILQPEIEDNYFEAEFVISKILHDHDIPVPLVYKYSIKDSFKFMISEFVEDQTMLSEQRNKKKSLLKSMKILARIHAIRFDRCGFIDTREYRKRGVIQGIDIKLSDFYLKKLAESIEAMKDSGYFDPQFCEKLRNLMTTHASLLNTNIQCSLVHRDFGLWNLLGDKKGSITVIDFEDAAIGDIAEDFARIKNVYPEYFEEILEEYVRCGGVLGEGFLLRLQLYVLRYKVLWAVTRISMYPNSSKYYKAVQQRISNKICKQMNEVIDTFINNTVSPKLSTE